MSGSEQEAQGWAGGAACMEAPHTSSSRAAPLPHHHEAHLHHQCSCHRQKVAELPFPGKAEMGMVCVMINLCVLHRPNLKCQPFRFCAILKEPFVEYLKATAHISQNRD